MEDCLKILNASIVSEMGISQKNADNPREKNNCAPQETEHQTASTKKKPANKVK